MVRRLMILVVILLSVLQLQVVRSSTVHDIDQDRAECTDQVLGMATCLPYVGGDAKAPTMDCCTGLKQVLNKSLKCVCLLVKDRNDPSLGLKVNSTLALSLPQKCNSPVNITKCIDLLKLPVSSPDAQMFLTFEKSLESNNTTSAAAPSVANSTTSSSGAAAAAVKSDGGRRRPWLALLIVTVTSGVVTSSSQP